MRKLGKFFDNKHFARGFNRSGEFTISEAQMLENFGSAMMKLYQGEISPEDEEEQLFLRVMNDPESAEKSPYATCWKKYLNKTQPKKRYTLCSTVKSAAGSYDDDDGDDDSDSLIDD